MSDQNNTNSVYTEVETPDTWPRGQRLFINFSSPIKASDEATAAKIRAAEPGATVEVGEVSGSGAKLADFVEFAKEHPPAADCASDQ